MAFSSQDIGSPSEKLDMKDLRSKEVNKTCQVIQRTVGGPSADDDDDDEAKAKLSIKARRWY